ncbi:DUF1801 domain-containing protein [Aequorivita sp. SDUM287046]|uniref:DUF1801 domain-containing protein n=1 Tax=Aequorivita aurantiaca TaxID=3053356 RepID=A0ABT8DIQ9_9FLAO|nr:DUF1801 domain-containing protein [Aequorivita aurantiaca]MDN3722887.1 DUF1801 domain-containing protein [Aequorivita aurantiaca]
MAKIKLTDQELVTKHIERLPKEIQPAIEYLRQLMLSIDKNIAEQIKWNAPAFHYIGKMKSFDPKEYKQDILVMNLRKNKIMCVLPTGATLTKNTNILEGDYTDGRRLITFKDLADIKAKENDLKKVIKEWLSLVEK